jgi:hypothetical protein
LSAGRPNRKVTVPKWLFDLWRANFLELMRGARTAMGTAGPEC